MSFDRARKPVCDFELLWVQERPVTTEEKLINKIYYMYGKDQVLQID